MRFTFDQFWDFTAPLEGEEVYHMFMVQDLQVATGMGITFGKQEGLPAARACSWAYKLGHPRQNQPCDRGDIENDYNTVLSMTAEGSKGGGNRQVWKDATVCRINPDSLRTQVSRKLDSNINTLKTTYSKFFRDFESYPADAQLALASVGWAVGPNFPLTWHKLSDASLNQRWDGDEIPPKWIASKQCLFGHPIGTQITRMQHQVTMFKNAASVQAGGGFPNQLYWPKRLLMPVSVQAEDVFDDSDLDDDSDDGYTHVQEVFR
jgi:hypothetical protein